MSFLAPIFYSVPPQGGLKETSTCKQKDCVENILWEENQGSFTHGSFLRAHATTQGRRKLVNFSFARFYGKIALRAKNGRGTGEAGRGTGEERARLGEDGGVQGCERAREENARVWRA